MLSKRSRTAAWASAAPISLFNRATMSGGVPAGAAMDATKAIPIVMPGVGDPVGSDFVTTLARPGGNVTGISNMVGELAPKRLAILHELVPGAKRLAVLYNPADPINEKLARDTRTAAAKLGLEARFFPVKTLAELNPIFEQVLDWGAQWAIWLQGQAAPFETTAMALAEKHKLPMMMGSPAVEGLVAYSSNSLDVFRKTAGHAVKILKASFSLRGGGWCVRGRCDRGCSFLPGQHT